VAVEVDGFWFHSTRPRLERDRRKDDDLRDAGIAGLRVTYRQLVRDGVAAVVRIAQAIARAHAASV
jgi:very-short-patch-repair endonuclease